MIEFNGEKLYRVRDLPPILGKKTTQIYADLQAGKLQGRDVLGILHVPESEIERALGIGVRQPDARTPEPSNRTKTSAQKRAEERMRKAGLLK